MIDKQKISFSFEKPICFNCIHFEDRGLQKTYRYNKKSSRTLGMEQTRFFCKHFREYLGKTYSSCVKYEKAI